MSVLKKGDESPLVAKLQAKLGIEPIGKFGPKTEAALIAWQKDNGIPANGIAGLATLVKLGLVEASTNTQAPTATLAPAGNSQFNLSKLKGHIPDAVIAAIPDTAQRFGITTPLRLAHFLAQCGHESAGFKATQENLNYSADGLRRIFSKYFPTDVLAVAYQRNPQKIANRVYGGRMGNGPEETGDGFKFRGRGYIQLTGKSNYTAFDKTVPEEILDNPDLVASKYALASAGFFFNTNGLWKICDQGSTDQVVTAVTKRVNGGTIGLADRIKHFKEYYKLLV
jgi:putative chitinase